MKLSVLLVATPSKCSECEICAKYYDDEIEDIVEYCPVVDGLVPRDRIDDECPLKPLPEKLIPEIVVGIPFAMGCCQGWNDCLDAITGETEC